jgi:hypothetical protein
MLKFLNRYHLLLIFIIQLLIVSNVKWGRDRWKQVIAFDGKGYYAYLPAVFIYKDLNFSFQDSIEKTYSSQHTYFDFRQKSGNGIVDKYFAGTSIAMLPFFIAGHTITKLTGGITDGYSFYYQVFISLAAIFYGLTGLYFLKKLLRLFNFRESIITTVIISFTCATPLFYYTIFEPSMSHVYSFAFINIFLFLCKSFSIHANRKSMLLITLIYAVIILIRPVNCLIVFALPFVLGSKENFTALLRKLKANSKVLVFSSVLFLLIISIQPLLYVIGSGDFFANSYGDEKIIWNRPEIFNILFSYRKGLFVYAPLLFISMFGLITLFKRNKFAFTSFVIAFFVISYVLSCWWIWWYGGGFGFRPMVEYYSLFAILFAFLLSPIKKYYLKILISTSIIFCFLLSQIQFYQYRYLFIHWEKMDKEHYWRVFMRVDQLANKEKEGNPNQDLLREN